MHEAVHTADSSSFVIEVGGDDEGSKDFLRSRDLRIALTHFNVDRVRPQC